ncbi:MAG: nicotinate-nucleotide adenylyltransferase [Telluria sp.]
MTRLAALLGGSFDPVHRGHLALAALFVHLLHPDELRVLPAGDPWQKATGLKASAADRIAMLELAFADAGLPMTIDRQEIDRQGPTYSIDTLRALRRELGEATSIVFLMGADQLQHLDSWREWRALFGLAHFAVAARPGFALEALPAAVQAEVAVRLGEVADLRAAPGGRVLLARELDENVSATVVRAELAAGRQPRSLVPCVVLDYIQQHNLYKN